jgi:hypothetical protein
MRTLIKVLNETAFTYYDCNSYNAKKKTHKYDCDGKYLTALQFNS